MTIHSCSAIVIQSTFSPQNLAVPQSLSSLSLCQGCSHYCYLGNPPHPSSEFCWDKISWVSWRTVVWASLAHQWEAFLLEVQDRLMLQTNFMSQLIQVILAKKQDAMQCKLVRGDNFQEGFGAEEGCHKKLRGGTAADIGRPWRVYGSAGYLCQDFLLKYPSFQKGFLCF